MASKLKDQLDMVMEPDDDLLDEIWDSIGEEPNEDEEDDEDEEAVENAFCPTGPGGGQRNDCPPANAGAGSTASKYANPPQSDPKYKDNVDAYYADIGFAHGGRGEKKTNTVRAYLEGYAKGKADRIQSLYDGVIKDWKSKSYKEIEDEVDKVAEGLDAKGVKRLVSDFGIAGTYGKKEGIQRIKDKITDLKRSREAISIYDRPLKNAGWQPVRTLNESVTIASVGDWLKKHGLMPGYGQIYKKGSHLWYVGGDGDEDGFADLVDEKLSAVAGVKKVIYEAESFPPEEGGWTLVYHPNPNKKVQ